VIKTLIVFTPVLVLSVVPVKKVSRGMESSVKRPIRVTKIRVISTPNALKPVWVLIHVHVIKDTLVTVKLAMKKIIVLFIRHRVMPMHYVLKLVRVHTPVPVKPVSNQKETAVSKSMPVVLVPHHRVMPTHSVSKPVRDYTTANVKKVTLVTVKPVLKLTTVLPTRRLVTITRHALKPVRGNTSVPVNRVIKHRATNVSLLITVYKLRVMLKHNVLLLGRALTCVNVIPDLPQHRMANAVYQLTCV
jgi:hypothetical protein